MTLPVFCRLRFALVSAVALTVIGPISNAEEEFDPDTIIEGRQAALRDIGGAFKGISDELKKSQPALVSIRQYARQIDDLAKQQNLWFPPGTGPDSGLVETHAKPEIWTRPAEFRKGQDAMTREAAKLVQVAAGENVSAIRAQWQALGRTCKSCHDTFRTEED